MLFQLAASPAAMLALFVFFKDKYEKEPYFMLVTSVLFGFISCGYVLALDLAIENIPIKQGSLFSVFVLSAGTEEFIKLVFVFFLNFKNKHLNEPFDAVIYSSYVCLGFAWAENIIYVFSPELGGLRTAFMRAIFSVPGHFLFSVLMGYNLASFTYYKKGIKYLAYTFIFPYAAHAVYNLLIIWGNDMYLLFFIPYNLFLWIYCLKKMKILSIKSPFKNA